MAELTDLARSLRYVQGQKQFIMFSSGLPTSLVYGTQSGNPNRTSAPGSWASRAQFDAGDSVLKSRNEVMTKEFAASGCTFFAFDTRESAKGIDLFGYDSMTMEIGRTGQRFRQGRGLLRNHKRRQRRKGHRTRLPEDAHGQDRRQVLLEHQPL